MVYVSKDGIRHAYQEKHNLEPDDLLLAMDVINTSADITLTNRQHLSNDVLVFKKDIDGDITFLTEVHVKKGYLMVFDAWRQKKARNRKSPDATKRPPKAHVHDAIPHTGLSSVSSKTGKKSRGKPETVSPLLS
jgi:hypothetical protein